MDRRIREAVRYLGYGRNAVDERTLHLIQECFSELDEAVDVRFVYRIFELSQEEDKRFRSESLKKNLKDCEKIAAIAITLGSEVDRFLRKYEISNIAKAVVFQACAASYLEEACDTLQRRIQKEMKEEGLYGRPRFSPGYGDFSISHQKELLDTLEAQKKIGLSITDAFMLTPTKSVTAIMGFGRKNTNCHKAGCEICQKEDCLYRRDRK